MYYPCDTFSIPLFVNITLKTGADLLDVNNDLLKG